MKLSDPIPTVRVKTGPGVDDYTVINEEDYRPEMGDIIPVPPEEASQPAPDPEAIDPPAPENVVEDDDESDDDEE